MARLYNQPHQFEPLLPSEHAAGPLLAKAHHLLQLASQVSGRAHPSVLQALSQRLRGMNSYYTNKIEGQHTLPSELESALQNNFSQDADIARKQRLAKAHMDAEAFCEAEYAITPWQELFDPQVISVLHTRIFSPLKDLQDPQGSPGHLTLADGSHLQPGQWRTAQQQVKVGSHEAPDAASLPLFLQGFARGYSQARVGEMAVVAVAAAHHRLAWMHPFADGNGRVVRLHSHLLLHRMGLTNGIWSPMRALARTQSDYYLRLAQADMPRRGDLDGRGNLSEQGLVEFINYFLDVCIDQARFMTKMLDMQTMRSRIRACLAFESATGHADVRLDAELALHTLLVNGPMERGEFKQITGLGLRTAERLMSALLKRGLLRSDSPRGKVIFGVPLHAMRFYFPALWPEAEGDYL